MISFGNFTNVLSAFMCYLQIARAIGNLRSICLGSNILSPLPCVDSIRIIPLLKALRVKGHLHFYKYLSF